MNDSTSASPGSLTDVQWMRNSSQKSLNGFERVEQNSFQNVENRNMGISTDDQTDTFASTRFIQIKPMSQIRNNEDSQQSLSESKTRRRDDRYFEEHCMPDPELSLYPSKRSRGCTPFFIQEAKNYLGLKKRQRPSQDETIIPMIVEKAAIGIIEEGEKIGKLAEAQRIATQLREQTNKTMPEVWESCARIYTEDTFLYKILNRAMRLAGSKEHESAWKSKIKTLGPFCILLWDDPFNTAPNTSNETLYRGANLTDAMIDTFKYYCQKKYGTFQAFSSCTRNRSFIETWNTNTLFIMTVKYAFTSDLKSVSYFPEEDEVLIMPGVCFAVNNVKFDAQTKTYVISLELDHRLNISENLKTSNELKRTSSDCTSAAEILRVPHDRNGDIIPDGIDAHTLRPHHCDHSAKKLCIDFSFSRVHPIRKPSSSRRNGHTRPAPDPPGLDTLPRRRPRIRSPDVNDDRPRSPNDVDYSISANTLINDFSYR